MILQPAFRPFQLAHGITALYFAKERSKRPLPIALEFANQLFLCEIMLVDSHQALDIRFEYPGLLPQLLGNRIPVIFQGFVVGVLAQVL